MGATRVTDLKVWQKAHQLTLGVYRLSRALPKEERFGLTSQMQRAAVSVSASIAEGFIRSGSKDKARFYNIGRASAEELRYYFLLAKDLGYIPEPTPLVNLLEEVCAMLHRLWEVVLSGRRSADY
jgi:four helix bundle protein